MGLILSGLYRALQAHSYTTGVSWRLGGTIYNSYKSQVFSIDSITWFSYNYDFKIIY